MILEPNDLRTLTLQACRLDSVRKSDLHCGDCVIVTTRNSVYTIYCLGDGQYSVSGGWFDREGVSPTTISINGCTWGGSAIHSEIVAARGLFLEFGNQVVTTRIQNVRILRANEQTIN
jgi:hypothetical protein